MCVLSAVMPQTTPIIEDWYKKFGGGIATAPTITIPLEVAALMRQMKEVLERLDALDKALGLRECKVEEAEKAEVLKKIRELVDRL